MGLQCQDPDWKPFLYNDRNKEKADTCEYGDQEAMVSFQIRSSFHVFAFFIEDQGPSRNVV